MADTDDKTQDPTPRRRQQARESGQVAHSQDLGSAVLLLGALGLLLFLGGALVVFLLEFLQSCLGGNAWQAGLETGGSRAAVLDGWRALIGGLGQHLLPLLVGAMLLALASRWLQTGFIFLPGRLLPDFSRVSPGKGLSRIWSGENFSRLTFGLFKVTVIAAVGLSGAWSRRYELTQLAGLDLPDLAARAWDVCLWSCLEMGGALLALAALDYLYQRSRLESSLQMTPQEVREEMREQQGDPQIATRRRDLARRRGQPSGSDVKADTHSTDRRAIATTAAQIGSVRSV
jgi:flagellar biosynthesis protein FlhB